MLTNFDFLVFAPNPWHGLWRNRQQIFSRLAGPNRVLYVEPARASLADWRRQRVPASQLRTPTLVEERPNLWLYRIPAWLPTRDTGDLFDRSSDLLLAAHLRRTLHHLGLTTQKEKPALPHHRTTALPHHPTTPLLWLYRPTRWRWAASSFAHRLLVYHITDDYTAFGHLSNQERQALAEAERELLAAADLTIVTAPRLLELKGPAARKIAWVPNGVDFEAFRQAAALSRPASAAPVLGYSGHISSRLDLPLLAELARTRPDWQLVFAGSAAEAGCAGELAALAALPNVRFLGVLPVEQVPQFTASCDVGLIPYRVNDETRAISSLKLYEFLAAGKPVVSARVPAAEEHAEVVHVVEATVDAWIGGIETALASAGDPQAVAARQAVAAANTWVDRVEQISGLVEGLVR
jgi:glycosyltransferase involved in cell wall biosynthesis